MAYVGEPLRDRVATRQDNIDWLEVYQANPGTPQAAWAKDRLIRHNQRFLRSVVVKVVIGYPHWQMYFEDICQEAQFGLLRAIDKFDASKGYAFTTYAYNWVRHFAQMGLATTTTVRKPFSLWEIKRWGARFESKFMAENGRKPTDEEMCEAINASRICSNYVMTPEKYTLMLSQWFQGCTSLDYESTGDKMGDNNSLLDYLVDPNAYEVELSEKAAWLYDLVGGALPWKLTAKEAAVLRYRMDGMMLKEVGDAMKLSYESIRSLNTRLLHKIHHARRQYETDVKPTQYVAPYKRPSRPKGGKSGLGGNGRPKRLPETPVSFPAAVEAL